MVLLKEGLNWIEKATDREEWSIGYVRWNGYWSQEAYNNQRRIRI